MQRGKFRFDVRNSENRISTRRNACCAWCYLSAAAGSVVAEVPANRGSGPGSTFSTTGLPPRRERPPPAPLSQPRSYAPFDDSVAGGVGIDPDTPRRGAPRAVDAHRDHVRSTVVDPGYISYSVVAPRPGATRTPEILVSDPMVGGEDVASALVAQPPELAPVLLAERPHRPTLRQRLRPSAPLTCGNPLVNFATRVAPIRPVHDHTSFEPPHRAHLSPISRRRRDHHRRYDGTELPPGGR